MTMKSNVLTMPLKFPVLTSYIRPYNFTSSGPRLYELMSKIEFAASIT